MIGSPVIIEHQDVTDKNADKIRCGVISDAYFNEPDGWYYAEGIIWDDKAISLINNGWSVSCSYDFLAFNDEGGEENNIKYDKEFTELNFTHLAIVNNPRYERANIVFNSKDEDKGKWVTVKGNHIFIPDGKTLDEVIKEKGWGDKENKQSGSENKHGFKKDKDSGYYMKDLPDGTSVYVEKKEGGQGEKEPFFLEATHFDKDGKPIDKKQYHYDSMDGMFDKIDKDFVSKGKQSDKKETEYFYGDNYSGFSEKQVLEIIKDEHGTGLDWDNLRDELFKSYGITLKTGTFTELRKKALETDNKTNNSKEQDMTLLDELKKLITKVENNKENEEMIDNEKVDKRKLIDEVGGILKGKVDEEIIRTIIKKMEEASYNDSEASADNKKVKNEDDEEKKIDNEEKEEKVDNEEEKKDDKVDNEEDEEKVEELKKEEKKDVENKCKNSKETSTFDKINAIYNSVRALKPQTKYTSRQEKLDNAVEYFKN